MQKLMNHGDRMIEIFQRALSFSILRQMSAVEIRKHVSLLPIYIRPTKVLAVLEYVLWYILWSLKWLLLFQFKRDRKVITLALFPHIASSMVTLDAIAETVCAEDVLIVHFGFLNKRKYYFNKNIFCHPYVVDRIFHANDKNQILREIDPAITEVLKSNRVPNEKEINRDLERLITYYLVIDKFVQRINTKHDVPFFLSDLDNADVRSVLCEVHRDHNVKTILIDHTINTYSQINRQIFSDHYLCWGEFHNDAYRKNIPFAAQCKSVTVVGHPTERYSEKKSGRGKTWIYFLPSFQHQTVFNPHRNIDDTRDRLEKIKYAMQESYPDRHLCIKKHPVDTAALEDIFQVKETRSTLAEIIDAVEVAFVEDSTVAVELLKYDVPIVYIANRAGEDSLHLVELGCAVMLQKGENVNSVVTELIQTKPDSETRKKAFEYYLAPSDAQWSNLREKIQEYLVSPNK